MCISRRDCMYYDTCISTSHLDEILSSRCAIINNDAFNWLHNKSKRGDRIPLFNVIMLNNNATN